MAPWRRSSHSPCSARGGELQIGDVGVLVVGDRRDHDPVRARFCPEILPTARRSDLAVRQASLPSTFRPRQQVETATQAGWRAGNNAGLHDTLDEGCHVFLEECVLGAAGRNPGQVDAQFRAGTGILGLARGPCRQTGVRLAARCVVPESGRAELTVGGRRGGRSSSSRGLLLS